MCACVGGGGLIFSSYQFLHTCDNALKVELHACMEGIALALEWSATPFILVMNVEVAAKMIIHPKTDQSTNPIIISKIK